MHVSVTEPVCIFVSVFSFVYEWVMTVGVHVSLRVLCVYGLCGCVSSKVHGEHVPGFSVEQQGSNKD